MLRFLLLLTMVLTTATSAISQSNPSDIVIVGLQSDGTDRFAWVPLVDLAPGQELFFTDAGWNTDEGKFQRQINEAANSATTSPSGGAMGFVTPDGGISAGTLIEVRIDGRSTGEPGHYELTVSGTDPTAFYAANREDVFGDQGISISTTGDQLIVFTGTALSPGFIFGVNTGADVWDRGSTSAQHASDLPAGLVDGVTAIAIGVGPTSGEEVDNGRYTGPTTGNRALLLSAITDQQNWERSDDPFDLLQPQGTTFVVLPDSIPDVSADTTVHIQIDSLLIEPEQELSLGIWVDNTSPVGLQHLAFEISIPDAAPLSIIGLEVNSAATDLSGFFTSTADTAQLTFSSEVGGSVPPGRHRVGSLRIAANQGPHSFTYGESWVLSVVDFSSYLLDTTGNEVPANHSNGTVWTGLRGDVNLDGRLNIMDVIRCVRLVLDIDDLSATLPGTALWAITDANSDGNINVADAVATVNRILGIAPNLPKPGGGTGATVWLGPATSGDGIQPAVPLYLETSSSFGGLELVVDATRLDATTPVSKRHPAADLLVQYNPVSHRNSELLRIIVLPLNENTAANASRQPLLMSRPSVPEQPMAASTVVREALLYDRYGHVVETNIGSSESTIGAKDMSKIDDYHLGRNVPNPFSPSTTIQYSIPVESHVRLTVHNILGQQVCLLTDRRHEAGNYKVRWTGQSEGGRVLPTGMYLYRLWTDTGYTETRRMLLLK